jgi:hypothetical protein
MIQKVTIYPLDWSALARSNEFQSWGLDPSDIPSLPFTLVTPSMYTTELVEKSSIVFALE